MVTPQNQLHSQTPNTRSGSGTQPAPRALHGSVVLDQSLTKSQILHLVLSPSPSIFYFEKNITPPEKCVNMRLDTPTVGTLSLSPDVEELVADTHNCALSSVAIPAHQESSL